MFSVAVGAANCCLLIVAVAAWLHYLRAGHPAQAATFGLHAGLLPGSECRLGGVGGAGVGCGRQVVSLAEVCFGQLCQAQDLQQGTVLAKGRWLS